MKTYNQMTDVGLYLSITRINSCLYRHSAEERLASLRMCLLDAAAWVHADNKERGWWTDRNTGLPLDRNVGELLMLMVSELAEVPSGNKALTQMDDKLPHRVMIEVELADCAIRILDTAGGVAHLFAEGFLHGAMLTEGVDREKPAPDIDTVLMCNVRFLADAMEYHRKSKPYSFSQVHTNGTIHLPGFDYYIGRALHGVMLLGYELGLDVPEAIRDKLAFNSQREDHKLEVRRQAGGKAY